MRFIFLLLAGAFFISCSGSKRSADYSSVLKKKQRQPLVDFACRQLKAPYKWGGNTPKGFDCSGFTSYCYDHFHIPIPRTAVEQSLIGKRIRSKKAKAGDLIFFKGADDRKRIIGHVGMVVSGKKKNIRFIHAGSAGVAIASLKEDYFSKRFKTIRRLSK